MHRVGKSPPNVQGAFHVRTGIVCLCVRVSPPLAAKKYAELFGKEKKEKKAKEPKMAAEATPKKEKKEKKPVVKEEAEEEEEEEEKPRAPAFKDPYLDLPKRCVYMRICLSHVGMFVCVFACSSVCLCVCVSSCHCGACPTGALTWLLQTSSACQELSCALVHRSQHTHNLSLRMVSGETIYQLSEWWLLVQ